MIKASGLPRSPALTSRRALLAGGMTLIYVMLTAAAVFAQSAVEPVSEFAAWDAKMSAIFEARPELKVTPGSGWKPYNRTKWFVEQRMVNGQDIPVGARWNAFLQKKEIEAAQSKNAVTSWFSLGPNNFAGRMLDIDFDPTDPTIIYAGAASGGVWKSTDAGLSWFALDDELPTLAVGAVCVLPTDPNVVIIGTGEPTNNIDRVGGVGIFRSGDGGATWQTTNVTKGISSGHGFHAIEAHPVSGVLLAGATDSLYRSTDGGITWESTSQAGNWTDVDWKPGTSDTVYAMRSAESGGGNRIRRSTDQGLTWAGASTGLPSFITWGKSKMSVTAANPAYLYAAISVSDGSALQGVYRSTDDGVSWTQRFAGSPPGAGAQMWYNLTCQADPNNAERVIVGTTPLYRSNNGGTTLNEIGGGTVHVDHHGVAYEPGADDDLWVATDGGIWESTNDGTSWLNRNVNLVTYQFYDICVSPPDPLRAWGGTQDNGTDRWVNSTTWLNGLGADGMVCNGHPTDPLTVYGEIQFGDHRKSINGGANWFQINNGITGTGSWVTPVEIDANDGNHLYTSTTDGTFRTLNGGSNWTNVDAIGAVAYAISPVNSDVIWSLQIGSARYSTDDGATWNSASPFGFAIGSTQDIACHPTDVNTAIVVSSGYGPPTHIMRTTDLGATWEDVSGDFISQPVNTVVIDPQNPTHWYVGTDVGVWASTTEGQAWAPFELGFPNAVVDDLEIQDSGRKLRAGTHGRGMWEVDISTAPSTGVPGSVPPGSVDLMLDRPYPNPLSSETVLRYAARRPGQELSLSIYDVQGRLVARIADHAADGVIRQIRWTTDGVADGVYLALLKVGTDQKTRKLHVVK